MKIDISNKSHFVRLISGLSMSIRSEFEYIDDDEINPSLLCWRDTHANYVARGCLRSAISLTRLYFKRDSAGNGVL